MPPPTSTRQPRPMAAGHVIVVVVIALLGGGIFNGAALNDAAARQPFGWKRTIALVGAAPFAAASRLLALDTPHRVLASAAAEMTGGAAPVASEQPEAAGAPVEPDRTVVSAGDVDPPATPSPAQSPTETEQSRRAISRRDPLRVWVGGDSLTSEFGPALRDRLAPTKRAAADVEFRFSTGLARPDYFDWPARLREIIAESDPDVFVVMFGANDGQNIAAGGAVLAFGSDEWEAEYRSRVGAVMDLLSDDGRTLYWVGQPIARAPDFDAKMQILNAVYADQAEGRERVSYVDTREMYAGADGAYAAYLQDDKGQSVLMRQQDGIHLTRAGGERLATVIFDALDDEWRLVRQPSR